LGISPGALTVNSSQVALENHLWSEILKTFLEPLGSVSAETLNDLEKQLNILVQEYMEIHQRKKASVWERNAEDR